MAGSSLTTSRSPRKKEGPLGTKVGKSEARQRQLLQPEPLVHQSLEAGAIDQVVGQFLIRKHA